MGEHLRRTQEKQRTTKRNRRIAAGVSGILLTGGAIGIGIKSASGGASREVVPATASATSEQPKVSAQHVPKEVMKAENTTLKSATKTAITETLKTSSYQEKDTAEIGGKKIHFAGMDGAEFAVPTEVLTRVLSTFRQFAIDNPNHELPVHNRTTGQTTTAKIKLVPLDKEAYILAFPDSDNIGVLGEPGGVQQPARAYTVNTEKYPEDVKVTFVRQSQWPDENIRAFAVEACQSMVNVELVNPEGYPGATKDDIESILQEKVCNDLGIAVAGREFGVSYEMYSNHSDPGEVRAMDTTTNPTYSINFGDVSPESFASITNTSLPPNILETLTA